MIFRLLAVPVLACTTLSLCGHARPVSKTRVAPHKATSVVLLNGKGPATLQATFSSIADVRIYKKPLRTAERVPLREGLRINTYQQAFPNAVGQQVSVQFVLLRLDQDRATVNIEGKTVGLDRGFSLYLQLAGGFHVGQVLPVLSTTERDKSHFRAGAVLKYAESCFGDAVRNWGGEWQATSGAVRITSVSRNRIAFALEKVRFRKSSDAPTPRDMFTVNGHGTGTIS